MSYCIVIADDGNGRMYRATIEKLELLQMEVEAIAQTVVASARIEGIHCEDSDVDYLVQLQMEQLRKRYEGASK